MTGQPAPAGDGVDEPPLRPGDRVVLRSTGEKGVVVWTWDDDGVTDCYVAFFGDAWPEPDRTPGRPYVLRYYASSLEPAGA